MDRWPLHDFHTRLGAAFLPMAEGELVAEYGDWREEHRALRSAAGVIDLSARGRLVLLGVDRQKMLNGQVTNNVRDLRPGDGCYAAMVNAKARMLSDLNIYALPNEILLDFEPGLAASVAQRLEKFIVSDDVQVVDAAPHYGLLSVQGPIAPRLIQSLDLFPTLPSKPHALIWLTHPDHGDLYLTHHSRAGAPGFDLFVPVASLPPLAERLVAAVTVLGGRACGWNALDVARVEAGIPRYGVDMDETTLPPEAGLEERAISYSKGCYNGQEVIARIRTYGQVARALRGLRISGFEDAPGVNAGDGMPESARAMDRIPAGSESPPPPESGRFSLPPKGTKLYREGKPVGHLTSTVRSPVIGGCIALGYVRRECNQPGSELTVGAPDAALKAVIVPLPFVAPLGA